MHVETFVNAHEERTFLITWLSWWQERRGFIFRAFAPKNAPQMNQAEVIHASWVHIDSPNPSFLDACQTIVRNSVILDVELNEYEKGSLSFGAGPSYQCRGKERTCLRSSESKTNGKRLITRM